MIRLCCSAQALMLGFALLCPSAFGSAVKTNPVPDPGSESDNTNTSMTVNQGSSTTQSGTPAIEADTKTTWKSLQTLYVGCPGTRSGTTFSGPTGIQQAIAVVQPYSTIKVCAGTYDPSNIITVSHVLIEGQGQPGAAIVACSPVGGDSSLSGFELYGDNDVIKNLTINNCFYGVYSSPQGSAAPSEVVDSRLNGEYYGVFMRNVQDSEISGNVFTATYYPIESHGLNTSITGNTIYGDQTGIDQGIDVSGTTGGVVSDNVITGTGQAIYLGTNSLLIVEHNNAYGNEIGIEVAGGGNQIRENVCDGNTYGFFAADISGAAASGLPNRFLNNRAFGNTTYDYNDATYPFNGASSGTDDRTANLYSGNRGLTANPASILTR